ncbi:MAG: UrcA family protein [Steroidobacteraceae bacterium]
MIRNVLGSFSFVTMAAIALAAPFIALTATPARAATPVPAAVPSITVQYADLDLDRMAGARLLYGRLQRAAAQVCGNPLRTGSRIVSAHWQQCTAQAVADAVAALDRPLLRAYHAGQTGAAPTLQTAQLATR